MFLYAVSTNNLSLIKQRKIHFVECAICKNKNQV